jgi:septal ring factor EnvC (AmiA/AmiB activator)
VTDENHTFERHAQTALVLLIVGLLSWVGITTHKTALTLATITADIGHLDEMLDRDQHKFQEIEQRLDSIEKAIAAIRKGN